MAGLRKIAQGLSMFLGGVAGCCLVGMVALTVLNIVMRRPPFHSPLLGAHELVAFMGALTISLSLPLNQLRKGNIKVEMLQSILPPRAHAVLEGVVLFFSGTICALISWRLWLYAFKLRDHAEVSMTLGIPFFPFILVASACFMILAIVLFIQTICPMREEP